MINNRNRQKPKNFNATTSYCTIIYMAFFWWLQLLVRWLDFPTNSTHSEAWHLDKNDHLEGIGFGGFFFQLAIFKFIAGILGM